MYQTTATLRDLNRYYGAAQSAVTLDDMLLYIPFADVAGAVAAGEVVLSLAHPCRHCGPHYLHLPYDRTH